MEANRTHYSNTTANLIGALVIVTILIAFFFPMHTRHREHLRPPTCQGNLKECMVALQMYTSDYDGVLPSSILVRHSKSWNQRDFEQFASRCGNLPPRNTYPTTWAGVLYNHIMNKDTMFCPSDGVDRSNAGSRVSYYWKTAVDKAWYGESCKKPCRLASDYRYKSDQIVLYERDAFHSGRGGLKNGAQINVAFFDSHVVMISLRCATSGDPTNPIACTDGEPMYFGRCPRMKSGAGDKPAVYIDPTRYCDKL